MDTGFYAQLPQEDLPWPQAIFLGFFMDPVGKEDLQTSAARFLRERASAGDLPVQGYALVSCSKTESYERCGDDMPPEMAATLVAGARVFANGLQEMTENGFVSPAMLRVVTPEARVFRIH